MRKIPTQLRWSEFVAVLKSKGFKQLPSKRGSARHFKRLSDEEIFTFHEPHASGYIKQGTLAEWFRKANLDPENLYLPDTEEAKTEAEEDRYVRRKDADGTIVSNCARCFMVVAKSLSEEEVLAAEAEHICAPE